MTQAVIRNEGAPPSMNQDGEVACMEGKGGSLTEYSDTRCMDCHLELTLDHVAMSCVMSEYEDLSGNVQLCKGISASLKANFQRADSNYQPY